MIVVYLRCVALKREAMDPRLLPRYAHAKKNAPVRYSLLQASPPCRDTASKRAAALSTTAASPERRACRDRLQRRAGVRKGIMVRATSPPGLHKLQA